MSDTAVVSDYVVEACARAAHEVNRAYCIYLGDFSQIPWEIAPDWQKTSCMNGVRGVLKGNGPEASHAAWLAEKEASGWTYGLVKDPEKKQHPCFVPYAELPPAQRKKDDLYVSTVRAVADAILANARLAVYSNGTETVVAWSAEDARLVLAEFLGEKPEDVVGHFLEVPDDHVVAICIEDGHSPDASCCLDWTGKTTVPSVHQRGCPIGYPAKTCAEWANDGRGFLASTEM